MWNDKDSVGFTSAKSEMVVQIEGICILRADWIQKIYGLPRPQAYGEQGEVERTL